MDCYYGPTMSEPTLYRHPTEAEMFADDVVWDETGLVPVEPVVITKVDGPFYVEEYGDLPYGTYAIVRLDDE